MPEISEEKVEVYPRVGGGNAIADDLQHSGLPSIPAWAGETRTTLMRLRVSWVYPRVGGGNAGPLILVQVADGLSPRGRGLQGYRATGPARPPPSALQGYRAGPSAAGRSIPAWAGETGQKPRCGHSARVYPRVGGGNRPHLPEGLIGKGLSPRGRGKPCGKAGPKPG